MTEGPFTEGPNNWGPIYFGAFSQVHQLGVPNCNQWTKIKKIYILILYKFQILNNIDILELVKKIYLNFFILPH